MWCVRKSRGFDGEIWILLPAPPPVRPGESSAKPLPSLVRCISHNLMAQNHLENFLKEYLSLGPSPEFLIQLLGSEAQASVFLESLPGDFNM